MMYNIMSKFKFKKWYDVSVKIPTFIINALFQKHRQWN